MRAYIVALTILILPVISFAQTATEREIDIVIEPATSIPAFYEGRPEPTEGSTVRAIAIVDGATDSYTYRWRVGNDVLTENTRSVSFTVPLGDRFYMRVDAYDGGGTRVATEQTYIEVSDPEVHFYQTSLLRGPSAVAIPNELILVDDEISIRAEPYFMDTSLFVGSYDLTWSVGGREVTTGTGDEQVLTLRKQEGSGRANIRFTLRNNAAFGQSIDGGFLVSF